MIELDGLLEQAVEEQAAMSRAAVVEAERELRQVVVEVLGADGALVGAEQPALEQRGDPVDTRHDHVRRVACMRDRGRVVDVASAAEPVVAAVVVGVDDRARLDRLLDRGEQALVADVGDADEPAAPHAGAALLDRDLDDHLPGGATATFAAGDAADVGLIGLDLALSRSRPGLTIARRSLCGSAQAAS
jgi:hypothetical protein